MRRRPWAALTALLIIAAGILLTAGAPPRAVAENNGIAVSAPLMGGSS